MYSNLLASHFYRVGKFLFRPRIYDWSQGDILLENLLDIHNTVFYDCRICLFYDFERKITIWTIRLSGACTRYYHKIIT